MKVLLITILVLIIGVIVYFRSIRKKEDYVHILPKFNLENVSKLDHINGIPKVIFQCYHDKSKIPNKVYKNIQKFAPGYKHVIYDDVECKTFLELNYGKEYKYIFEYLLKRTPAHASDLWRYCMLYKYGGVYLDIKTELIEPIDTTFNKIDKEATFVTNLSADNFKPKKKKAVCKESYFQYLTMIY